MRIGLIDVDGHHFPNLALMRISAWHKAQGDLVEWWQGDMFHHYDRVYKSKIFSDAYSPDVPDPINADEVIRGGTGYCIYLGEDGKEHFDESRNVKLPDEVERMFPDYSIYPQFPFAVAMTSRGCPRGCQFCVVAAKEGRCAVKVADVSDFWRGEQKEIKVLDPNILACREKRDLLRQYRETGVWIDFNQGLDIRCINDADIEDLNAMKIKRMHVAWDNPKYELAKKFREVGEKLRIQDYRRRTVYCLTNYEDVDEETHVRRALHRIYTLMSLGYTPYLMIYNKASAPRQIRRLGSWCNNPRLSRTIKFEEYDEGKRRGKNNVEE